jgi:ABC-type multidrug transport system ATPase subunit
MSDKILRALLQLFAILATADESSTHGRETVRFFISQLLGKELAEEYLKIFDEYLSKFQHNEEGVKKIKRTAVSSVKVIVICEQINAELAQKQKMVVLVRLLEFMWAGGKITDLEMDFVETVYSSFNISAEDFNKILSMVTGEQFPDDPEILRITSKPLTGLVLSRNFCEEDLQGEIRILRIPSVGLYLLTYAGANEIFLNGVSLNDNRIHVMNPGSSIRGQRIQPVYYSDVQAAFLNDRVKSPISYKVNGLEYRFPDGAMGLHPIHFEESSGKLIGIMGGSGAGKSTLLNILNGNENPTNGRVSINGFDLHREKDKLEGIIGFVSQDDLLMEDLSVFHNLFYNTKLCFADLSDEEVKAKVESTLADLGLTEVSHLKVGTPLDKTISGGQRKRLNIALELIREPLVLFVDEPTSGLSSRDSENIMDLLKELTLRGRIVFVVIHQPSSDIFKLFDKLLILDRGGYPIYYGNPIDSVSYFKHLVHHINPDEGECLLCGNVNPEQVFNIIETRVLDEYGNPTPKRKMRPVDWHQAFLERHSQNSQTETAEVPIPINKKTRKPGFISQFMVFLKRDVRSKIANRQYLLVTLLEAPLLAVLLAFMTRYALPGKPYVLFHNKNLIAFLFMSVVVALFLGMIISAEEIFRDRKIRKRESFFYISYLFVLAANPFTGLKDMNFAYWLIMFSTSCFANLLGLNISASFKSAVTIYILIPFLIIPQLLLSGVLVRFEDLQPALAGRAKVPFSGEVMASRWAFEALATEQYLSNRFNQSEYELQKVMQLARFRRSGWYSAMEELLNKLESGKASDSDLEVIRNGVKEVALECGISGGKDFSVPGAADGPALREWLIKVKKYYASVYNEASDKQNAKLATLEGKPILKSNWENDKLNYSNQGLNELVMHQVPLQEPVFTEDGRIYPSEGNVFYPAWPHQGVRTHFYAPEKNVFGKPVKTIWVNVIVLWLMTAFLWLLLYFDGLKKLIRIFGK